jgi:hypothetical protein
MLIFLFCFPYSELSSLADRPDVTDCVPLLRQGEHLFSNEDCTKVGCRGRPCFRSFVEACYGEFRPGLLCHTSIGVGETNANLGI